MWTTVESTPHEHEQFGLDLLRDVLPDQSPYRAWANFEFIADSGHVYEVDCLVVTPKGIFLVELKHYHGKLEGNMNSWYRSINGRSWEERNPYLLANRKAKMLQSELNRQVGRDVRLPFISALVFLSNADQDVQLRGSFASGVVGPVGAPWVGKKRIPSIKDALADPSFVIGGGRKSYSPLELASAVKAFSKLGIKPHEGRRSVGDYILGKTLEHGDVFQDYVAEHRRFPERKRRIRLFPHAKAAGDDQRRAAGRAAEREFTLFSGQAHPGIEHPDDFSEHQLGPALFFEFDEDAVPLDQWLRTHANALSVSMRLRVFRDVAEALSHAHGDRIFHRALNPSAVWVSGSPDSARVRIRDWHAGVRAQFDDGETRLPTVATSLAASISSDGNSVDRYRSPELRNSPNAAPRPGDIFSLGALGYLILSGVDPAGSASELDEVLLALDGLSLDGVVDGVSMPLRMLIWQATQKDPADRFKTIEELLADLDEAEGQNRDEAPPATSSGNDVDPLEARKGDVLEDRFLVLARLGKGASAVALLVEDDESANRPRVLKVATAPEAEQQLRDEAAALERLTHQRIVRLLSDPLVIGGRQAILLARAGEETLAQRLATTGTAGEFLERWGVDLLKAVAHLEDEGIAHRDIKPANIGIAEQGTNRQRHLVLFDFSLTKARDSDITAGTTGFVDPFLRTDGRNRWDSYAERFAAAVVLYQMATGDLPTWGPGNPDPMMVDAKVQIDPSRFDAAYAGALSEFFAAALARDIAHRHGSAEQMVAAWVVCFEEPAEAVAQTVPTTEPVTVGPSTPVDELGLSTKAVSTLQRASVYTVAELLAVNMMTLNRMRGVGKKTVAEVQAKVIELRGDVEAAPTPAEGSDPGYVSVDRLVRDLLDVAAEDQQHAILSAHLGIDAPEASLPNQTGIARQLKINQGTVSSTLLQMRGAWAELPSATKLRDALVLLLDQRGGVASLDQLAGDLLAKFGSAAPGNGRGAMGRAAARALFDIESDQPEPRWLVRRKGDTYLAAIVPAEAETASTAEPEAALSWASKLGVLADKLAEREPPLAPTAVVQELRRITGPVGLALNDQALVSLAVASSSTASLSARRELYPTGMAAPEAIRRSAGSLLGLESLDEALLDARVRARFSDAAPLPPAEELVQVLDELQLGLEWNPTERSWTRRNKSSRMTSHIASSTTYAGEDESGDFAQRLASAHDSGRLLIMSSPLRHNRYRKSLAALSSADVSVVDVDHLLIDALKTKASGYNVDWTVILESDAAPHGSADASNFRSLVETAFADVESELTEATGTLLLHNLGLLARYDRMSLIEKLHTAVKFDKTNRRSLWVLLPSEGSAHAPMLDGVGIGTQGPSEFTTIPNSWVTDQEAAT